MARTPTDTLPLRILREMEQLGFPPPARLLAAVSGGADSVVLLRILSGLGYLMEVAHVNHGLRGAESDGDEAFVADLCAELNLPLHTRTIGREEWKAGGDSRQTQARNLRYQWFDWLLAENPGRMLVLAHHAGDQAETLLFRFLRGSGWKGLQGMKSISGNRIRPMLGITRAELTSYARSRNWTWREDSSNATSDYTRNRLRHQVFPVLEKEFPGFGSVLLRNASRFQQLNRALEHFLPGLHQTCQPLAGGFSMSVARLKSNPVLELLWQQEREEEGFRPVELEQALNQDSGTETRIWLSTHGSRLERKGDRIAWGPLVKVRNPAVYASLDHLLEALKNGLEPFRLREKPETPSGPEASFTVHAGQLRFPLTLRPWQAGDKIRLPGMKGRRKAVSDLLSECDLLPREKENLRVWVDREGQILWIPGIRSGELPEITAIAGEPVLVFTPA